MPSQVLSPQPCMFLHILERMMLRLVGRWPLLPLSHVGRGPLHASFPAGGESLLLPLSAERGHKPVLVYPGLLDA